MNHLFPYIERTLLHPNVTLNEQYEALDEVTQLGLTGLTVAPFWVKKFRREMGENHPANLATVIGFPFGYQRTEAKQTEIEWALNDGAADVEIVLNTSALFSPASVWLKIELAKLVVLAHAREKFFTVIVETAWLDTPQTQKMIKLAVDTGADFIKNATGFIATASQPIYNHTSASQFRQFVPRSVGVKIVVDGATDIEMEELVSIGVERLSLSHMLQ